MTLDVLIGILLFISAIVNILALGAFWITPSLRTTSNRFVINLLIANLISCIILAPSFLLNAATGENSGDSGVGGGSNSITINSHIVLKSTEINETIKCFNNNSNNNSSSNNNNSNTMSNDCISNISNIKIVKNYSSDNSDDVITKHFNEIKCWGLDLAAALGSLSVLLVVGDTWCAVTDPLRYHTRISSLKAWIMIVTMWIISIVFGFGSAFRNRKLRITDFIRSELIEDVVNSGTDHSETINKTIRDTIVMDDFSITENLYTTIYSYLFFIIIILIPFIVVCAMYWRIFSEARGNGLRMRQNGSSPLLQSALNLAAAQQNNNNNNNNNINNNNNNNNSNEKQQQLQPPQQQPQTPTHYTGLTLKIDNRNSNSAAERPPIKLDLTKVSSERNQNILLTVTTDTPTIMKSANSIEYMRRNHSARQLFLLESTNNIRNCGENIRHVHSTPNLQKLMFSESSHHHHHHHHHLQHYGNGYAHHSMGNTLSPNLQVPPKALSYMTSIRHRLSNASSLFKYREESRAARISILVVIMFLVSYLPYGILILIQGHVTFITSYQSAIFAILTVLLANLSSPFIFAYRNKRVCRGVKHLLGLEKKSNQNNIFRGRNQNTYKTTVAKVKRSGSKASTYSQASNRYLTPQSALKGTFVLEIEKCTDDEDSSYEEKKSFLKRICDTSRKWDCTTDSCSGKVDNEQTEV